MLQRDAPLLMNPTPSWHKYSWMAEFVAQIPNYRSSTIDTVKLAIEARKLLIAHSQTYDFDFNQEDRGILHFYRWVWNAMAHAGLPSGCPVTVSMLDGKATAPAAHTHRRPTHCSPGLRNLKRKKGHLPTDQMNCARGSDPKEYKHAEKVNELYKEGGLDRRAVTPTEIRELEPALQVVHAAALATCRAPRAVIPAILPTFTAPTAGIPNPACHTRQC